MSEKTLLVELEKDKEKLVEKKLAQAQEVEKKKEKSEPKKENKKKYFNAFSSKSFKGTETEDIIKPKVSTEEKIEEEKEIDRLSSKVSQVIEKPNYDYMETLTDSQREKIFKIERAEKEKAKTKPSKLKMAVICVLFAVFGVWGLVNIIQIDSIGGQISEAVYQYELKLPTYLQKLTNLDAASSKNMENLFETIPDEDLSPTQILEKSNWFDRFCNFIAGLFGG